MDCSLLGSSVHGILQARTLEWAATSSSGDLPDPGIEFPSPALAGGFFTTEPPGKPKYNFKVLLFHHFQILSIASKIGFLYLLPDRVHNNDIHRTTRLSKSL